MSQPDKLEYDFRDDKKFMDLLDKGKTNLRVFCLMFLNKTFHRPFSERIHKSFFEMFDDPVKRHRSCIISARAVGKTSLLKAFLMRQICYKTPDEPFFGCFVSYAQPHAEMQTEALKRTLRDNQMIQRIFNVRPSSDVYRQDIWQTSNGATIANKGIESQISGLNVDDDRPNYFAVDDLTDPETEASDTMLVRVKRRFWGELYYAVDYWGKAEETNIMLTGTIKGANSLLFDLQDDPDNWHTVMAPGGGYRQDGSIESNWQAAKTDLELMAERDNFESKGMLDIFEREIMCLRTSPFSAEFKPDYYKYYEEKDRNLNDDPDIINVVICDPGREAKPSSAHTAITAWGIDVNRGILYFRDCESGYFHRDQIFSKTIDMARRHNADALGAEDAGLGEHIRQPFQAAVNMAGLDVPPIEWMKPRGKSKADRASQLIYYYRTGRVYHNKTVSKDLELQQLEFPNPRRWDVLDTAAYVIQMMERGGIYFQPSDSELAQEYSKDRAMALERLRRGVRPRRENAWKTVM